MRKLNLVLFPFLSPLSLQTFLILLSILNKFCCSFFLVTISLLRMNSRKLNNITQFPVVGHSEPENWIPQWSWGSTSFCFSAVFLQVSTQLQFLCKICVKYGCWPRLHTFYLMFIETRHHCYQAPMLPANLYWKRSNSRFRFTLHCRDVRWYVLRGTRLFISLSFWSGICRREHFHCTLPYFKVHPAQTGTRQDESALWKCSRRANDLSEMHCWCPSVSADFSEYFRKSSLTQTQGTPAVKFCGSKWDSCLYMKIRVRPALPFGTASSHYFQLCSGNLCNNSFPSLIFVPFKYKGRVNTFSWVKL